MNTCHQKQRGRWGALWVIPQFCPSHQITLRKSYVLLYSSAKIILINYIKLQTSGRNIYSRYIYSDFSTFSLKFSLPVQQNFGKPLSNTFLLFALTFQWLHSILKWNSIHFLKPRGKYNVIVSRFLPKM